MISLSTTADAPMRRRLPLSEERMYGRVLAGDPEWDGRFFTGVLTTGIYCLPSCKARKPKRENVRFFPTCAEARAAGLRPCRKCHPDDFERGADPVREAVETLVAEVRRAPGDFADVAALVKRSGYGATRFGDLSRLHFHRTPAEVLVQARLADAKRRLRRSDAGLAEIAVEVGFESMSVFHDHFRRQNGLTPAAYRELGGRRAFEVALPEGFPVAYLKRTLGRDPHSVSERIVGDRYETAVRLRAGVARLRLDIAPEAVAVEVVEARGEVGASGGRGEHEAALGYDVHALVVGLLGLEQPAAAWARLAERLGLARLVKGREELRVMQTPTVFDGLVWAVIGQQINLPFACLLRRRLVENLGTPVGEGLIAPPGHEAVAAVTEEALLGWQFSRQKAAYLRAIAKLVADRALDLDTLAEGSATGAARTLGEVRGLGPWSVNYVMMRSLGFADCVPLGDTGVTSGLQTLLALEKRPDVDATRRLMAPFAPYRSLATMHLWQINQPTL